MPATTPAEQKHACDQEPPITPHAWMSITLSLSTIKSQSR
eukprot:CAMPEP_0206279652 /NCGR_PEP_ID=MMETSP0047_2-20121206/38133_1 /ASSEMBLY_ACC=CAM_ASM_000192 /TAXON_ID=195065 /ORGANISM="Chroomonas mesostigmatica_cf, Strain CCMP1168" /LENGTH=39 /DNA_ID= /DNA_START= /DNA_END= /DNA_ORIENTATION=